MARMNKLEKAIVNSDIFFFFHKIFGARKLGSIGKNKEKLILEIGCGAGITTHFITKKWKKSKLIATDFDPMQLQLAKARNLPNVIIRQENAENLSFNSEIFDLVIEIFTLHHVQNWRKALEEIKRVLRKGGRFVFMDCLFPLSYLLHSIILEPITKLLKEEVIKELNKKFKLARIEGNQLLLVEAVKK